MDLSALVLALALAPASPQEAPPPPERPAAADPSPPPLPVVTAPGLKLTYQQIPWSQRDFEAVERGLTGRVATRFVWPIAQLETTIAFTLDGARLPPGSYALVFRPNLDGAGMVLELKSIAPGEPFLHRRQLAEEPSGDPAYRGRIVWQPATEMAPRMRATVAQAAAGVTVTFHLGDRVLVKEFRKA